jgi:hypothetical protein
MPARARDAARLLGLSGRCEEGLHCARIERWLYSRSRAAGAAVRPGGASDTRSIDMPRFGKRAAVLAIPDAKRGAPTRNLLGTCAFRSDDGRFGAIKAA